MPDRRLCVRLVVPALGLLVVAAAGCTGVPGLARGPGKVVAIDSGNFYTCALLDDGTVDCWGQDMVGRVAIAGLTDAVELAVGERHACARLAGGDVACWGANRGAQLGRLEPDSSAAPLVVPEVRDAVEIAAARNVSCARLRDGRVTCWGQVSNDYAGDLEAARARLPTTVADVAGAQAIVVDNARACARTGDSEWRCWMTHKGPARVAPG